MTVREKIIAGRSFCSRAFARAVCENDLNSVTSILDADPSQLACYHDKWLGGALQYCATSRRLEMARLLMARGDSPLRWVPSALEIAAMNHDTEFVRLCLHYTSLDPLIAAVWLEDVRLVKSQLSAASFAVRGHRSESPLHIAFQLGNIQLVELLMGFGFSPDERDKDGQTARDYAVAVKLESILDRFGHG